MPRLPHPILAAVLVSAPPLSPLPPISVPLALHPCHQGPALRTLMQFVEIEPSLCVSAAKFSHQAGVGEGSGAGKGGGGGGLPGEGTLWGGLFAELVRTIVLGPCSMQPKLLKSLGEDYVNVHDDVR